jgi:pyruvate formate lyase activating enzyme
MEGVIFNIKHYALHDGPGIRQTVFLKGCPLSCWWCHNPESRSPMPFSYLKEEKIDGRLVSNKEKVGYLITVDDLLAEIERDVLFFEESGGGVTFSGGEPLAQPEFLTEVLRQCRLREIHTCVDTTAFASPEILKRAALHTDLFLVDLKLMNSHQHRKYTGVSNHTILDNIRLLDKMGKEIVIRFPLIPGINDDESNLFRMMAFLSELRRKPVISILPYHRIGKHKYERFGMTYKMNGVEEPSENQILKVRKLLAKGGFETRVGE